LGLQLALVHYEADGMGILQDNPAGALGNGNVNKPHQTGADGPVEISKVDICNPRHTGLPVSNVTDPVERKAGNILGCNSVRVVQLNPHQR
jgi:hypothetical protein